MVFHIGTSGWHYDEWGHGVFYPKGLPKDQWLAFYAQHFDTVEINNTFYRLPKTEVTEAWGKQVQDGFRFTMKASRSITHVNRLRDCGEMTETFASRFRGIGEGRAGAILYQLPPYQRRDDSLLEAFLEALPLGLMHAFEFRHKSWFADDALGLLNRHNAGLCVHDMPEVKCPVTATASFAYIRLHGEGTETEGDYSDDELAIWAERARSISGNVDRVFVYFDNDTEGRALANARSLREMLHD